MFTKTICGLALAAAMWIAPVGCAADSSVSTRATLSRNLPQINISGVTFKEAIDFLRDVSGLNLHVNWKAIEAAGVLPDTPINLKLRDVPMRKVLTLVLNEAAGGVGLAFYLDDGVVEITTREIADGQMLTLVYPVQDLLFEPAPVDVPPDFGLYNKGMGQAAQAQRNGRGPAAGNPTTGPDAKAHELIELITETVYPESWIQNGGKSSIKFFSGNLIVTAPRSIHEAIGGAIN
jgi:hypothetical protein